MVADVIVSLDAPYCQLEISKVKNLLDLVTKAKEEYSHDLGQYRLLTANDQRIGDSEFMRLIEGGNEVGIKATLKRFPTQCARCKKQVKTVLEYQKHWRENCTRSTAKVLLQPLDSAVSVVLLAL